jgi:TonB-dependent starch-binding outer membrane protein SusC
MRTHRIDRAGLRAGAAVSLGLALAAGGCIHGAPSPARSAGATDSVPVGYGTMPRSRVASSIGSVTYPSATERPRVTHVLELLQGRVAGVNVLRVEDGYMAQIRGTGSLANGGEPLYVVDGIPLTGPSPHSQLSGLDPSAVTRIDVLKDAGASAIYGERATNGVILISLRHAEP